MNKPRIAVSVASAAVAAGLLVPAVTARASAPAPVATSVAASVAAGAQGHRAAPVPGAHPDFSWCTRGSGYKGICTAVVHPTALLDPHNRFIVTITPHHIINVQCWYPGRSSDGYWDHVTWTATTGTVQAHLDDGPVDLAGKTPVQVGLPQCG